MSSLRERVQVTLTSFREKLSDRRARALFEGPIVICGQEVTELKPIRVSEGGTALNKAGRLVLRGRQKESAVKIYEAANTQHAEFIAAASKPSHLAHCFPAVRIGCGRFLMVNWSEYLVPSGPPVEALVGLLRSIHQTPVTDLPEVGFDYWHDYIKPRFSRAVELLGCDSTEKEVITHVSRAWDRPPRYLAHPDLTPRNVVFNFAKQWQVIDNELLSIGGMPLFDVCNTAYALGPRVGRAFVDGYIAATNLQFSDADVSAVNAAWLARMIGTAFVVGNLVSARQILERYQRGEMVLPVTLTANAAVEL